MYTFVNKNYNYNRYKMSYRCLFKYEDVMILMYLELCLITLFSFYAGLELFS